MKIIDSSIVFIGMTSSGKTTLANELSKRNSFKKASFGGYLFDYAQKNNFGTKKEDLQIIGQNFIETDYKGFLSDVIAFSDPGKNVIFEGVRHLSIMDEIKNISDLAIVFFIDTPAQIRFERFNKRENSQITWDEFVQLDEHPVEREIKLLKHHSDVILDGNKDVDTLIKEILKKV